MGRGPAASAFFVCAMDTQWQSVCLIKSGHLLSETDILRIFHGDRTTHGHWVHGAAKSEGKTGGTEAPWITTSRNPQTVSRKSVYNISSLPSELFPVVPLLPRRLVTTRMSPIPPPAQRRRGGLCS